MPTVSSAQLGGNRKTLEILNKGKNIVQMGFNYYQLFKFYLILKVIYKASKQNSKLEGQVFSKVTHFINPPSLLCKII
ncbi:unnamed protein product, partial [Vitis vinifera]|uniref:Uncharacterized protein n=1 Tax=Vitis vinifera TaxID=29760 RepID=D7U966_VITVI